jgi:hypothetical protein
VREKYCWLVAGGWFVLKEKYCWLVADKPNEQGASRSYPHVTPDFTRKTECISRVRQDHFTHT